MLLLISRRRKKIFLMTNNDSTENTVGKCPVQHGNDNNNNKIGVSECPVKHGQQQRAQCPVQQSQLSPDNKIPMDLENRMEPSENGGPADQQTPLPIDRQISTIPRGPAAEHQSHWVYPSQQQFYNALKRKNHETNAEDIESILHIHNDMNERCWQEIVRMEQRLSSGGCEPRLVRFAGRPSDMTPKARILSWLGMAPKPFDRHDWIVDRCGREVRYVIDYYHAPHARPGTAVFYVDARPALDNVTGVKDRLTMFYDEMFSASSSNQ